MNLVEMIDKDMIDAMKKQEKTRLMVIRGIKAAMKLQNLDHKREINDELAVEIVAKEIKTRNESIKEFAKGSRQDLIDKTQIEIEILNKYLPTQLTEEEIDTIINDVFEEVKPTSIKDMGKIMGKITPLLKGKADMGKVSPIIKNKLESK